MSELHEFSTGVLTIFPGLRGSSTLPDPTTVLSGSAALSATRTINSGASYANPAPNIVDGNAGTTAAINAHTAASPSTSNDWFTVDLGQPYTLTQMTTQITAQGSGTNTVKLFLADRPNATPSDADVTLVDSWVASVATHTTTLATAKQGRYLLIDVTNTGASSVTFAEVTATAYAGMVLALVQTVKMEIKSQRKVLYGPAQVSRFPADVGFFGGEAYLEAENASIRSDTLRKLLGSTQTTGTDTTNSATTDVETIAKTVAIPSFAAVLQTANADNTATQTWILANCRAPGAEIPAKKDDFVMPKFRFCAYPDAQGALGTIYLPQ